MAIPAAQAELVYTPYTGLRAPLSGAYLACSVCGAADYWYPASSMLIDPVEVCPEMWAGHGGQHASSADHRYIAGENGYAGASMHFESSVHSSPGIGFEEVGAVGGAAIGAIWTSGVRGYGSLGDRAGTMQVTSGGYSAQAKVSGVAEYYGHGQWMRRLD